MKKYNPQKIEKKWQKVFEEKKSFFAKASKDKQKFYVLVEFPYPSGDGLHVGHCRSYTGLDIISRKRRMEGKNVLFPIGWDAFGLPTENYAIKHGIHPSVATKRNTDTFRKQLKSLGFSFDWSREVNTTDPAYYKWTQWIFLQLFKHNLAYKDKIAINWCPKCKIGLANEEVVAGNCERCGAKVEKREKDQWMIKITKYADRLIKDLDNVNYLEKIKIQQKEWIGRSEGVNLKNKIKDLDIEFEVYDSIPQTFMAQTFTVIAPDHPLLKKLVEGTQFEKPVLEFAEKIIEKRQQEKYDDKTMDGIFTGRYVENYCGTGRDLPIWVASYVVTDYGTGIVNCSAHDERDFAFAKKYNIPLRIVLLPKNEELAKKVANLEVFYREPNGIMQEPTEFAGLTWGAARKPIIEYIVKNGFGKIAVHYKLRDWVFSRQHYWGEPIPLVHCNKCGWVAVAEKDLPVKLPKVKKYEPTDNGESPLAVIDKWVNVKCPKCNGPAKRETDTMPNWAGSNWYYLAYTFAKNGKFNWDNKEMAYWMGVDWYNGGMEHTTLHLLYSRFIFKFLWDIGAVPKSIGNEPYKKRTSHGMVLGEGGIKMSKSKGNVINPDQVVGDFGADTLRIYEMFMGPFDQAIPWDTKGVIGSRRFLERIYNLVINFSSNKKPLTNSHELVNTKNSELDSLVQKTIKKVSEDIEEMRFNTAVSALMILVNAFSEKSESLTKENIKSLLLLLSPFAPHLAEELWAELWKKPASAFGSPKATKGSGEARGLCCQQPWPKFDEKLVVAEKVLLIVQINGKVRDKIEASFGLTQADAEKLVNESEKIKQWLSGSQVKKIIYIPNKVINIVI